jgi:hypothetical protein
VLGFKLLLSFACELGLGGNFCSYIESHESDIYTSIVTVSIFFMPLLTSVLFNFPKRRKKNMPE